MNKKTSKLIHIIVRDQLSSPTRDFSGNRSTIKEQSNGGPPNDDSRGIVKALQDWVNRYSPQQEVNVEVIRTMWKGSPNYMIGVGKGWIAYSLDGVQDMASRLIRPDQLDNHGEHLFTVKLSKLKQWLQGQPNTTISSAIPPPPPLKGTKVLQQEQDQQIVDLSQGPRSASGLKVNNDVYFFVVVKPTAQSTFRDTVFKIDPVGLVNQFAGGLKIEEIVMITTNQQKAVSEANKQLRSAPPSKSDLGVSQHYQRNRQFVR